MTTTFAATEKGYANLWSQMTIRPERVATARAIATALNKNRARYEAVGNPLGIPWWWIAAAHQMEGGANFSTHLHNGDSLRARTTSVPAGRPAAGSPPFTWEESAIDALKMHSLDKIGAAGWTIPRALFEWERYNGFAYMGHINSPYVWSYSNLYTSGKVVRDHGPIEMNVVSAQCGAAVMLRALMDLGYVVQQAKENPMDELTRIVQALAKQAPTLATEIGGPLAGIAVQVLANAAGSKDSSPQSVVDKLHELGGNIPDLLNVLMTAEQAISQIASPPLPAKATATPIVVPDPAPAPQPVIVNVQPAAPAPAAPAPAPVVAVAPTSVGMVPAPATGPLAFLDGYKTAAGIAITAAGFLLYFTHYITADVSNSIVTLGVAVGGYGLIDKWTKFQKVIPFLPALPISKQ